MTHRIFCGLLAAGLCAYPALAQPPQPGAPTPAPDSRNQQQSDAASPEVLEHGPIHEAFADPLKYESAADQLVVKKAPPEPVNELPPEFKPEGDNVEWIPGYWMYDEPRKDYVWVSGVYRNMPPGQTWVMGYWSESDGGYAWTPGFWTSVDQQTVQYLPHPPESLESGPTSPPPGDEYFWIPGCWQWRSNNYAWQAGYWHQGYSNWVWTPHHYCYTPRGAVFVRGFWDYPFVNRGLLYAPVYWNSGYQIGYRYRPHSVLSTVGLLTSLFVGPQRGYYYGSSSYYANFSGYQPWYAAYGGYGYTSRRGYDPLLAYYAWNYGQNQRGWQHRAHDHWQDDWRRWNQRDDIRGRRDDGFSQDSLVRSVENLSRSNRNDFRLTRLDSRQLEQVRDQVGRYDQFRERRQRVELEGDARTRRDYNPGVRGQLGDAAQRDRGRDLSAAQRDAQDWANRARSTDQDNPRLNVPDWARERGRSLSDLRDREGQSSQQSQRAFSQQQNQADQRARIQQQYRDQVEARQQLDQRRTQRSLSNQDNNPLRSLDPRRLESQPNREQRGYRGPVEQRSDSLPPTFRGFRGERSPDYAPGARPDFNRSAPQLDRGRQLQQNQLQQRQLQQRQLQQNPLQQRQLQRNAAPQRQLQQAQPQFRRAQPNIQAPQRGPSQGAPQMRGNSGNNFQGFRGNSGGRGRGGGGGDD